MDKPLPIGLQLLQMMLHRKYHPATIECTRGLFLLSQDRKSFSKELINFLEDGHSEQEFWNLIQQKAKQLD